MKAEFICVHPRNLWTSSASLLFRRWHLSSRVVALLAFLSLVVVNLPGNVRWHVSPVEGFGEFELAPQYEHGWPLTYITRQESVSLSQVSGLEVRYSEPTVTKCWQFWGLTERDEFHPAKVAGDILNGLMLSLAAGYLFEIWRRRHRSFFQIHLLDIGLGMTALAIILGWYVAARTAHEQEQALLSIEVDEMTEHGLMRSDQIAGKWEKRGPTWLRLWVGDRYFEFLDRVVAAEGHGDEGRRKLVALHELRKTSLAHRDLSEIAQLRQMPQLEELDLALRIRIEPGSEKLIRLPRMRNLRVLIIRSVENSATGLDQMQNLRVLRMHDSFISDETIHEISRLKNLRKLSLNYSYFAPKMLAQLRSLPALEALELDNTTLRGEELAWLPEMRSLKTLSLQRSNASEGALDSIARCQNLETLYLDHLTESGLQTLSSSPRLRYIEVDYPAGQDVAWLKQAKGWTVDGNGDLGTWTFERKTTNVE